MFFFSFFLKTKCTISYNKTIASEFSDRVMNLNKYEDRNLSVRIKQMSKENRVTINFIKREIDQLKRAFDTNQDRIDLIRKQRQMIYEENLRKLLESKNKTNDMDIMNIYDTSKNLAAFYNLSAKKQPQPEKSQQQQVLIKRNPSRLSARNKYLLNSKSRICHSSYSKSSGISEIRLANSSSTVKQRGLQENFKPKHIDLNYDDNESIISTSDLQTEDFYEKNVFVKVGERKIDGKIKNVLNRKSASAPVQSKRKINLVAIKQ
jgi:hypothetical protein